MSPTNGPDAGALYRALAPSVLGYLRGQRAPHPEDLLGDVFVQVVRDLPRFRGDDAALRRWVFAIAHNRLIDARRQQARRPQTVSDEVPERAGAPGSEAMDQELVDALGELTPGQRDVVLLRFVADLDLRAAARILRRSVGAVKALQHRALAQLAARLAGTAEKSPDEPYPRKPDERSPS